MFIDVNTPGAPYLHVYDLDTGKLIDGVTWLDSGLGKLEHLPSRRIGHARHVTETRRFRVVDTRTGQEVTRTMDPDSAAAKVEAEPVADAGTGFEPVTSRL